MGLHKDEINFCLSRIRHHLLLFTTQNPIPAGVSLFMLVLYVVLPSVFRVLLHSFPVFVMITLAVRFTLDRKIGNVNVSEPQESNEFSEPESPMCKSGDKTYKRAHSVRRRNAKLKENFNNIAQEKDVTTTSNEEVVDKVTLFEDNPKDIREVKREIVIVPKRVESSKRGNKEDDDENDEKNSMDIAGLSEAERNTRLESLMAKRKARKMLSVQLRKALVKMGKNDPRAQFASILIPKATHDVPTSPTPSCAPCVLFPTRNPFDIPYDSHEEKPNLSEDGFQKEFVANQSKNSPPILTNENHDTKQMIPNITDCASSPINEPSNVTNEQQDMIKDTLFVSSPASSSSNNETTPSKDDTVNISIPGPPPPNDWNNNEKGNEEGLLSSTSKEVCHTSRSDSNSQVEVSGTTSLTPPTTIVDETTSHSDHGKVGSIEDEGSSRSREVHELREQDIMDVVFSGLEPSYEQDLEENESPVANESINMINHDHKHISTEQSRKGKSIVEENNTYEADSDDIPNNNGKEVIDYIKDTYDEQPSYDHQPSSSSSNNIEFSVNRSDHVNEINHQKEYNPFAASSSHSNITENETSIANNNDEQQDVQQEMVVGEGSYDSSSSSSTSRSSSTHEKIIQTDQDSSDFHKPTNEKIPKSDQSAGNSLMTSISSSPQNEMQINESNVTPTTSEDSTVNEFNLRIGSGQMSTQETIPYSTDEMEAIKEEEAEADSDEMNNKGM
ncbi:histone-lysine N-methyltransferase set-2-like [Impatiens glandulifera]|uniref:histone-lysine N-methyltransferase set-2-like n=1 Tax=Impatiens glandulifera TaxID=253017 RepID=UPI001FB09859|nr:histone-lysine N-methyltransferase set-2-like [Impatiens glandulifera]